MANTTDAQHHQMLYLQPQVTLQMLYLRTQVTLQWNLCDARMFYMQENPECWPRGFEGLNKHLQTRKLYAAVSEVSWSLRYVLV